MTVSHGDSSPRVRYSEPWGSWPNEIWACALLALGTAIAFCQVVHFKFVNYDDNFYVYDNLAVQQGVSLETVQWAFGERRTSAHWHPLTWLSLALDCDLYGTANPGGFHATNLLLHLANTLLLFWVLRRSTGAVWRSAAVAGFFAWHPLHVESVAWITERKDMLSTFFWMLTMLAYVRWVQSPSRGREGAAPSASDGAAPLRSRLGNWKPYVAMVLFFALGLLSKPMVVTLPCVLLLWDYWPLRRKASWQRLVLEKTPLFALALTSGIWTSVVMHEGTRRPTGEVITLQSRAVNGLLASVTLLRKMVWPSDLAPYYPVKLIFPPDGGPPYYPDNTTEAIVAGLFLAFTTFLVWNARVKKPYLLMGWLWYLGTLVLVVLRLQAGSFTWADRYTYVPMIGIFIAVVWGVSDWVLGEPSHDRLQPVRMLVGGFVAALLLCLALTWQQVKIWADSETLWTHTLEVTKDNFLAQNNLGMELIRQKRIAEAIPHMEEAVRILPNIAEWQTRLAGAHAEMARELAGKGQFAEAGKHRMQAGASFFQAGKANVARAQEFHQQGDAETAGKRLAQAGACFRAAVECDPGNEEFRQVATKFAPRGKKL